MLYFVLVLLLMNVFSTTEESDRYVLILSQKCFILFISLHF
jgi:hypothetical protein